VSKIGGHRPRLQQRFVFICACRAVTLEAGHFFKRPGVHADRDSEVESLRKLRVECTDFGVAGLTDQRFRMRSRISACRPDSYQQSATRFFNCRPDYV